MSDAAVGLSVVFFLAIAGVLGLALRWAIGRHLRTGARAASRTGLVLIVGGMVALVVAVARYGQQITTGVVLALIGTMAVATGLLLVSGAPRG